MSGNKGVMFITTFFQKKMIISPVFTDFQKKIQKMIHVYMTMKMRTKFKVSNWSI